MAALDRTQISQRTHRLIASRFPTVGVFDDLTEDPDELRVAFLLEAATNDRFALLNRRLGILPDEEIVTGDTASLVMAAFLHADPAGGRFTDERLGAWYAALDIDTAIAETLFHSERRLQHSEGAFPTNIQIRELIANIDCELRDIRGKQDQMPELYEPDPADYGAAQRFASDLRWPANDADAENGLVYDSVRKEGRANVCIFRPSLVSRPVLQGDHFEYRWDATGKANILQISNVTLNS